MWLKIASYLFIFCTCFIGDHIVNGQRNGSAIGRLHIGFLWPKSMVGHSDSVAFMIGLKKAEQSLPGYEIDYVMKDSMCNPKVGIKAVLHLLIKYKRLDAIIGSQCSQVCEPVGLLASLWNIPLVSSRCSSTLLSDKTVYPTFSRARGNNLHTSRVILNLLQTFGWQRYTIISSIHPVYKLAAEYLRKFSVKQGMDVQIYTFSTTIIGGSVDSQKLNLLRSLIQAIKRTSRMTLLYMYHRDLRNFLILAKEEGFLDKGNAFVGLAPVYRGSVPALREFKHHITDAELYQGLIAVTGDDGPITEEWEQIKNETLSHYSSSNISIQEMETTIKRDKPISGEEW